MKKGKQMATVAKAIGSGGALMRPNDSFVLSKQRPVVFLLEFKKPLGRTEHN